MQEEKYWFNCYKSDKHAGKGKTWREILQQIHEELIKPTKGYWRGDPDIPAYLPQKINNYFSGWRHHRNDGGYWTNGAYDRIFVGWDPETNEKIYINGDWHDPEWKVREGGTFLTDSYGRIIPSGYVKACYLRFKPNMLSKPKITKWYRCYGNFVFRKGPVEGIHKYRNGRWHKYSSKTAGRSAMKRQWYRDNIYKKEIFFEYGITFKMDGCEDHTNYHNGNNGHGWKRTRKEKQWMKGTGNCAF